jgi:hypothetical protein
MSVNLISVINVKKPYNKVMDLLNNIFTNMSTEPKEYGKPQAYKFETDKIRIELKAVAVRETEVYVTFLNMSKLITQKDLDIGAPEDNRKEANFIRMNMLSICEVVEKRVTVNEHFRLYIEFNKYPSSSLYYIYPQYKFVMTHNLPGRDFIYSGEFCAKFNLIIYDKTQVLRCDHVGVPGHVTGPKFFEAQIVLACNKTEDEIQMTSTSMTISKKVIELDKEVMEKLLEWLKGSRLEEEEKNNTMYVDLHEYLYEAIEHHKYN